MIQSFANKDTERLWNRERVRLIDSRIHSVALRTLRQLAYVQSLEELRIPPGNRLEALKGGQAGSTQYSHQQPVADLLSVDGSWSRGGRGR